MKSLSESIIGKRGSKQIAPADLETGYIVQLRDGNYYVVMISRIWDRSYLCRATDHNIFINIKLSEYDSRMNSRRDRVYDIVNVWKWKDDQKDEYIDFFKWYDENNKEATFGKDVLISIITRKDLLGYEKIF